MNELHDKLICDDKLVPKEGQRDLLCSNKESHRCPSLSLSSMRISNERITQFMKILEKKTGKKLSEQEALTRARILLRAISLLYHPVSTHDFNLAMIQKMYLRKKNRLLINAKNI